MAIRQPGHTRCGVARREVNCVAHVRVHTVRQTRLHTVSRARFDRGQHFITPFKALTLPTMRTWLLVRSAFDMRRLRSLTKELSLH